MKFIYQFDDPAVYEKKAKNSPLFGTDLINPSKGSISYEDFKVRTAMRRASHARGIRFLSRCSSRGGTRSPPR